MERHVFRLVLFAFVVLQFGTSLPSSRVLAQAEPAAAPVEEKPLVLPLAYRSPGARALVIAQWSPEGELMGKLLLDNKIKVDRRESIDLKQQDYSTYHLIVGLSNFMDGYGYEQNPPILTRSNDSSRTEVTCCCLELLMVATVKICNGSESRRAAHTRVDFADSRQIRTPAQRFRETRARQRQVEKCGKPRSEHTTCRFVEASR